MNGSIFKKLSLDRKVSHWEDFIGVLTPVEKVGEFYFKREDAFAPLGYGGVNGAKVRQILWLVQRYLQTAPRKANLGLMLAGSVKSPQLGRIAAVAKHFGIPAALIISSRLETAYRNENVRVAANFGAEFHHALAPYNPVLQSTAKKLHEQPAYRDYYLMEYGLSVEGTPERIESFYRFASEQVKSVPPDVDTIFLPAGSCNTVLAVLYGIARLKPKSLKRVVLFGIGPTRIDWYEARLRLIEKEAKLSIASLFRREYKHHADLSEQYGNVAAPYDLIHYDLHSTKFASYQDEMPATYGGIVLHPTYEGKMLTYIRQREAEFAPYLKSGRTLFWIVGSTPSWEPMEPHVVKYLQEATV